MPKNRLTGRDVDNHLAAVEFYMRAMRERIAVLEDRIDRATELGEPVGSLVATLDKCRVTLDGMETYQRMKRERGPESVD
jgi:hypothetical protein